MPKSQYRRVVLKLSGEAFADTTIGYGIDAAVVQRIAEEVAVARDELDVEIAVVVGGGNIWRGMSGATRGMDRARADYMGMLATVINALALQDALESIDQAVRVQTAIEMAQVAEPFIPRRAIRHLEKGRVVVFAAGHRQPVLHDRHHRGAARSRDRRRGDPEGDALGRRRRSTAPTRSSIPTPRSSSRSATSRCSTAGWQVMDSTAITFCMDNRLPIIVFDVMEPGNIRRALVGEPIGTLVRTA